MSAKSLRMSWRSDAALGEDQAGRVGGACGRAGMVRHNVELSAYELTPHPTKPGQYETFELPAGVNHLDGAGCEEVRDFSYNSNDFYRGQRQQQLIWAIKERALQCDAYHPAAAQLWRALQIPSRTDLACST